MRRDTCAAAVRVLKRVTLLHRQVFLLVHMGGPKAAQDRRTRRSDWARYGRYDLQAKFDL